MAPKVKVVLTGSRDLNKKLSELTNSQAREAIRMAARPALLPTLSAARALAPKRRGNLSRSIKIRSIRRSRSRIGARVTTSSSANQFSGKTFYAGFQEWGWMTGSRKSQLDRTARRIARQLRTESRKAGRLSGNGTSFRERQEKYFQYEGVRRASVMKRTVRRKVVGKRFLRRAVERTRTQALRLYSEGILSYIRRVMRV